MKGLTDKVFVVTAGGSGIGLAVVERLVREGAKVVAVDIADGAVKSLRSQFSSKDVRALIGDVGSRATFDESIEEALTHFGGVHGMVNNAGIVPPRVELLDADPSDLERVTRTNVWGTFHGIQVMLRYAIEHAQPASIVNTASGQAMRGAPASGFYAATKSAILSLTRTAAAEAAAYDVRVNAVLPGPTATPTLLAAPQERLDVFLKDIPMGRFGAPAEVASAFAWLLSDESSFITGALLPVDGGQTA